MFVIKLKYPLLLVFLISAWKILDAQTQMIRPSISSGKQWGYQDSNTNIVVDPIFDNVTPMVSNFYDVEPKQLDVKELLNYSDEASFFRNPIGIVIKGDSMGIVDHKGNFLLNPMKCKLRTIYQESEMKFVENLEEESDDYGKIALISQSGLFITPFMMCQIEEYDGGRLEPHQYYYRHQAVDDIFLTDCEEPYNIFINQTDGFMKQLPDSLYVIPATDGYYFVENSQKQKIDLFHNDTFIKSIDIAENYSRLTYFTKGIFSMTNDQQNCILMDTSGRVYYAIENGYLEGVNDHGHARVGQNNKIIYVDKKGDLVFETSIGMEYYSNKDGYQLYEGDSIVKFDTMFNKTSIALSRNEEDTNKEYQINRDILFNICQDSTYNKELEAKNIYGYKHIKTYEFDKGKYNIIEFGFGNVKYIYPKCDAKPFFPYEQIYNFEYIENDIFLIYEDQSVIAYHYLNGEIARFPNESLKKFSFQGKEYYYSRDVITQNLDIYNESFIKFERNYKGFEKSYNGIECHLSPKIEKGDFVFEIFGHQGVISFDKLNPNFVIENIKFWHHRNMADSYSIYMGIRDTFSFHIVELNFSNIIENPKDYKVNQYSLEFDPYHTAQTKQNFLDRKNLVKANHLDSLICVMLSDDESICLNLNKKANERIDNSVLYPETHSYYYNRRVKFDCNDVGYVNKQGKQVIPYIFNSNDWTSFKYGVAIVMQLYEVDGSFKRKYGLIDTMGKFLIPLGDCDLKFDHLGKFVVKECNVAGFSNTYFYDLTGKLIDEYGYVDNNQNYLFAELKSGGYRVFTGNINDFFDVSHVYVKGNKLWVKIDDVEYIVEGNQLVLASQHLFKPNKSINYYLSKEVSIQVDEELLTFVQNHSTPITSIVGNISRIDFKNGFVYISDKFQEMHVYTFSGEKLFNAKHYEIEYYPAYKLFIWVAYNRNLQRETYQYYYVN